MRVINVSFCLFYLLREVSSTDQLEIHSNRLRRRGLANSRVIGGSDAKFDKYPWFVQLGSNSCGGSLVSPEFILTAAHCYKDSIFENRARIGAVCQNQENCRYPMEKIAVKKYFKHPNFVSSPSSHDFMLLRLKEPSSITPVKMDDGSLSPTYLPGRGELWTIGLGVTNFYQEIKATRLQHLELEYINNTVCDELYADDDWDVQDNMMCARNNDPTKQACFGDSGGPLYDNKEQKLVGVTSFGDSDCTTKSVVYARIAAEIQWITSTICENSQSTKPDFCFQYQAPSQAPSASFQPSTSPSVSVQPSVSVLPTVPPSVSVQPSVSILPTVPPSTVHSFLPSISHIPTHSSPSQNIYFQMATMSQDGQKFCIQKGDKIKLQECDETNAKQLWRADASGQIRSRVGDECKCLTHIRTRGNENLEMDDCEEEGKMLSKVFVFNGFQNTILWLKTDIDWQELGWKAVSVRKIAAGQLVTIESRYDGENRSFFQTWHLIYPNVALS